MSSSNGISKVKVVGNNITIDYKTWEKLSCGLIALQKETGIVFELSKFKIVDNG